MLSLRMWIGVFVALLGLPMHAVAQSIAGVVRDTSGGVLPGVTVEASSPALIERTRSAVTDSVGQYRIVDLRPGVYTITFALQSFSTVRREGIELTSNFTASVNAELTVGAVEQSITVSGSSPVVDLQNAVQQRVLTRDVLDATPSGKFYQNLGALIPGMVLGQSLTNSTQDVGGALGNKSITMAIHGGAQRDQQVMIDGMNVATLARNDTTTIIFQDGNTQELSLLTGINPAEIESGGVRVNLVPKEGGNRFSGSLTSSFSNSDLQSDNLDEGITNAGLRAPNRLKRMWDVNPAFGGPVRQDALWFFLSYRQWAGVNYVGGQYYNQDPTAWVYVPDTSRQGLDDQRGWDSGNVRLTWQASPKNRFNFYYDHEYHCDCHRYGEATTSPEATLYLRFNNNLKQVSWTSPIKDRLLLEAGASWLHFADRRDAHTLESDARAVSTEDAISEQSSGMTYRARPGGAIHFPGRTHNYRASLSYITGTHAFKSGINWVHQGTDNWTFGTPGHVAYRVLNGIPNQVTYYATPYHIDNEVSPNIGMFAQDQWTVKGLTLNAGVRFDWFRTSYKAVKLEATRFMVAREFPSGDVLNWKDLSPRLSLAYDLFGNGKTALKAALSRYVLQQGADLTINPVASSNNTSARQWTDRNGDFIVQGDPFNPAVNGELGVQTNLSFGQTVFTLRNADDMSVGFGVRPYNWEGAIGVQHELAPRVAVEATYFRRSFGNFIVTDNTRVGPADYDPFCVTAPSDSRLPDGGGYELCSLYNLTPSKVGQVDNVRTLARRFGEQYENWNGVDLTMNARLPSGVLLQGGMSTGKSATDNCDVAVDSPSGLYCHTETALRTQVKFLGSYPLPWWNVQVSGTLQSIPGSALSATYVATNAVVQPSLGRPLSSGSSVNVNLITPGTVFNDRTNQVDMRVTKEFRAGVRRVKGMVDVYNVFNANTILTLNNTYGTNGSAWLTPQVVLPGRLVKFAMQVNF